MVKASCYVMQREVVRRLDRRGGCRKATFATALLGRWYRAGCLALGKVSSLGCVASLRLVRRLRAFRDRVL